MDPRWQAASLNRLEPFYRIDQLLQERTVADKLTAAVFDGHRVRAFGPHAHAVARRNLKAIDAAKTIDDLRVPPGNGLKKLVGDRKGQWSIRINDPWRACFRWENGDAHDVEITDYH